MDSDEMDMNLNSGAAYFFSCLKVLLSLVGLALIVLLVNSPIIAFDMMYFEQPIIYLVNQKITSLHDLLQVYAHPMMLDALSIPFFRPSGHFLTYQIITRFLDWHNTKGFLIVNFLFLALSFFMMIKLYSKLFPRCFIGGFIAVGIYVMHPALLLSRLSPMHFEFACVFFLLLSLYCFVIFCQKNQTPLLAKNFIPLRHYGLLILTLLFFLVSATYKEVALMLGPVLALSVIIALYQGQTGSKYFTFAWRNRNVRQLLMLLSVATITFAFYLFMMWPSFSHPLNHPPTIGNAMGMVAKFFKLTFGLVNNISNTDKAETITWEIVIFPLGVRIMLWLLLLTLIAAFVVLYRKTSLENSMALSQWRKAFLFVLLASLAFAIMPLMWGRARPWHLTLSLVFISLMLGFSCDFLLKRFLPTTQQKTIGFAIAILLSLATIPVGLMNTDFVANSKDGFALRLIRNAVLKPPMIQKQLNAGSVVIVEDSTVLSDYMLGDSVYPRQMYGADVDIHRLLAVKGFYEFPLVYGGTLFRWAYLQPNLQEQVYPFQIAKMQSVPNVTIYFWLQHYHNIFCLGYDDHADWHDRSADFKKQLLLEMQRRHLVVNQYDVKPVTTSNAPTQFIARLIHADPDFCQYRCDANKQCHGFAYLPKQGQSQRSGSCYFYEAKKITLMMPCKNCLLYTKTVKSTYA